MSKKAQKVSKKTTKKKVATSKETKAINNLDLAKGKILYDNILVKPIMVEDTGLVLKPQQYEDKPEWGEVLDIGEGRIFDNGTIVPLRVVRGDLVLFQKYSAQKFRHAGEDYLIIKEEDIYYISSK